MIEGNLTCALSESSRHALLPCGWRDGTALFTIKESGMIPYTRKTRDVSKINLDWGITLRWYTFCQLCRSSLIIWNEH